MSIGLPGLGQTLFDFFLPGLDHFLHKLNVLSLVVANAMKLSGIVERLIQILQNIFRLPITL
jgi:hypothetical protein